MLAIDTNLIVRYLTKDDQTQAIRARKLIDNNDTFVCVTVMLETEWVLRSVYGFSKEQCAAALQGFAGLPRVAVEDPTTLAKALGWMHEGLDFADGLHLAKAEGCEAFVSFDRGLAKASHALGIGKVRTP